LAGRSFPPSLLLDPADSSCLQKSQQSRERLLTCSSPRSHNQSGREAIAVGTGQGEARPGEPPQTFTTRARTENQAGLKKSQTLAISATWPAFQGAVTSADSLRKTLSAEKPKKFTVCYSAPNKDGKQALLAEQLFQPKYHLSPHMCISQYYRPSVFFAANSKIAFKGRIQ